MNLVTDADPYVGELGIHRCVINLLVHERQRVEVRACEVLGPNYRNRYSFPISMALDDLFLPEMAAGIRECLGSLSDRTEVVSLPTFTIEFPGVTLATAQMVTTKQETGPLGVMLRFRMLLGGISAAFRPEVGVDASLPDHSAHTSALVLTDLVMPMLDLCSAAEAGGLENSKDLEAFLSTLANRAEEIRFHAELIKRFVANASKDRRNRPPAQISVASPRRIDNSKDP